MLTQAHTEILRLGSIRPPVVVAAGDPRVQSNSGAFQLDLPNMAAGALQLCILRTPGAFAAISWAEPTTAVGVQFWGDANDGYARILVDGAVVWQGNTQGENITYEAYIQITGLPNTPHTVSVEATGQPGSRGGCDVTIAAFGWGVLGAPATYTVFVPLISNP
jgi:hypothetical protein